MALLPNSSQLWELFTQIFPDLKNLQVRNMDLRVHTNDAITMTLEIYPEINTNVPVIKRYRLEEIPIEHNHD